MNTTVVLIKGTDRREMVREALSVLGDEFKKQVLQAKKIFIHPNLVYFENQLACTNVETLRGVVDHISLVRGDEIVIGDAGYHDTKRAFKAFNYESLSRSGNIKLVDLNDDETIESFAYDRHLQKKPIGFSKMVAESDFNIVVVPAKMHSYFTVSLSIKTHVVGSMVVPRSPFGIHARWPWIHSSYKSGHMTLADVYIDHPAHLVIIDGVSAMEGNSPGSGTEIKLNWLIASLNPIAADALASYLMGFDPYDIGYLFFLEQKDKGPITIDKLDVVGPNPSTLRKTLTRPDSYPEILGWR